MSQIQAFAPAVANRPSDDSPDKGSEKWVGQYLQWMYAQLIKNVNYQTMMMRMYEERLYANGTQNPYKYIPKMGITGLGVTPAPPATGRVNVATMEGIAGTNSSDKSYLSINWKIVPILPKIVNIIVENVVKRHYFINVNANDPTSQDEKAKKRFGEEAKMLMAKLGTAQAFNQAAGMEVVPIDPEVVKTIEEVNEKLQDFKLETEAAYEIGINGVLMENRFEDSYPMLVRYAVMHNMAITLEKSNGMGKIDVNVVDPLMAIYDMGSASYNARHFGHVIPMTPTSLREFASRFGKTWSDEEYKELVKIAIQNQPPFQWWTAKPQEMQETWKATWNYGGPTDSGETIYVMYGTFYSNEVEEWEEKEKKGGKALRKITKEVKESEAETYTDDMGVKHRRYKKYDTQKKVWQWVYEGYWIVGTTCSFGTGVLKDMTRSKRPEKMANTILPYKITRPTLEQSMVRDRIPQADGLQLLFLKRQQLEQAITQTGVSIRIPDVIQAFTQKDGPPQAAWKDALAMYQQLNVVAHHGQPGTHPISPISARGLEEVMQIDAIISNRLAEIEGTSGLNAYTSGATPDTKALVGTGNFAAMGTSNALAHIVESSLRNVSLLCEGITGRLQTMAQYSDLETYELSINRMARRIIKETSEKGIIEMGFEVSANPDEAFMEGFYRQLESMNKAYSASQGAFGISPDVYLLIKQCRSVKQQVSILKGELRKQERKRQEFAAQQQQMNGQIQIQSTQAAEQMKQQTLAMKMEAEAATEKMRIDADFAILDKEHALFYDRQATELEGKLLLQNDKQDGDEQLAVIQETERRKTELAKMAQSHRTKAMDLLTKANMKQLEVSEKRTQPRTGQ